MTLRRASAAMQTAEAAAPAWRSIQVEEGAGADEQPGSPRCEKAGDDLRRAVEEGAGVGAWAA